MTGLSTLRFHAKGFLLISLEVKLRVAKPLIGIAPRAYFFQALWLVLRTDDSPLRLERGIDASAPLQRACSFETLLWGLVYISQGIT